MWHESLHKEMKTRRNGNPECFCATDKEWKGLERYDKEDELSVVNWGNLARPVCSDSFPLSVHLGYEDVSFFPAGIGRVPLTWGPVELLLGWRTGGLRELPASASFFKFLQLKILIVPNGHILGYHFLNPINTKPKTSKWSTEFPVVIVVVLLSQSVWLFAASWTVARQAAPSMGFPRQEYWSGLPFPSPGDLPDPGIKPLSPAFPAVAGRFRDQTCVSCISCHGRQILYH